MVPKRDSTCQRIRGRFRFRFTVEHARVLDIKGPNMREYTASLKAESDKGYWD